MDNLSSLYTVLKKETFFLREEMENEDIIEKEIKLEAVVSMLPKIVIFG